MCEIKRIEGFGCVPLCFGVSAATVSVIKVITIILSVSFAIEFVSWVLVLVMVVQFGYSRTQFTF